MNNRLDQSLRDAIACLHHPHVDDGRRHPAGERLHARSVAFLAQQGLVPDARARRYLDRAAVVDGMVIALPDLDEALLQLAVDWTNHNCLHDDAVEDPAMHPSEVAAISRRYAAALRGEDAGDGAHPLARAMVAWHSRALALGVDPSSLERFAARAGAMASQFVLDRLMAEHEVRIDEAEYLRQRVQAGPFDAWFALIDALLGAEACDGPRCDELRVLAVQMNVYGNELRTLARELAQGCTHNLIARAADPEAATLRLVALHNAAARRFRAIASYLGEDRHQEYALTLARAVWATHVYELRSIRGLARAA